MIWLIGCKGMLGTEIARQLSENKIDFVGTDIDVDITNPQALADFVKGKDISYIINCSAYTAVDKAESDADFAKKCYDAAVKAWGYIKGLNGNYEGYKNPEDIVT
jgi:dTDP-4-dehydrorhamnose reductase